MPDVSVVIPVHNRPLEVGEAIASALHQDGVTVEVIVVDDGSTDSTRAAVSGITDERVTLVPQPHAGIACALNAGCSRAQGKYVLQLGSDDRLRPGTLRTLLAAAEARPDAVVAYGRAQGMGASGRPLPRITGNPEPVPGNALLSALFGDFIPGITALVDRDALLDVGSFDATLPLAEDWDLWVRLARRGPFTFVDQILADFRIHQGRVSLASTQSVPMHAQARLRVLDKAFAASDLPEDVERARSLAYRNVHVDIGLRWLQAGAPLRALGAFGDALRTEVSPLDTLARIAYLTVFLRLAPRCRLANSLSDAVAKARRERRSAAA